MKTLATITIIALLAVIAGALIWPQLDHRSDVEKSLDNVKSSIQQSCVSLYGADRAKWPTHCN